MAPAEGGRELQVAHLDVWVALSEEHLDNQIFTRQDHLRLAICANEEFSVGRNLEWRHGQLSDPTVSNQHIKFHSIVYDTVEPISVPPLVYAENRSMNGTYLQRFVDPTRGFHKEGNVRRYSQITVEMDGSVHRQMRPGKLMDSNMGATLLDEEDELWVTPRLMLNYHVAPKFRKTPDPLESELSDMRCFDGHYKITGRKIGSGGHGSVYVALHRKSQRQLACKIINLGNPDFKQTPVQGPERYEMPRMVNGVAGHQDAGGKDPTTNALSTISTKQLAQKLKERRQQIVLKALRECKILRDLDHPNIISLEKVYHSPSHIYIFEEMVTAGDLFSYIEKRGAGNIPPIEAAVIVWQILKGLEYLHDRNIVHRDLKPDNILLTSTKQGARIVIADFGAARYMDRPESHRPTDTPAKRMFSIVGTIEYTAPEIYQKNGYSMAVDMWSIGCITASLLSGDVIFVDRRTGVDGNTLDVVLQLASACDLGILDTDHFWKGIDDKPKDFIRQSLVLDESKRMTVKQALGHAWFTHDGRVVEFEAAYERAIKKWKPRGKIFRAIEQICPPPSDFELGHRSTYFPQDISQCLSVPALGTTGLRTVPQRLSPIQEEPEMLSASPAGQESSEGPDDSIPSSQMPTLEHSFQNVMTQLTISEPDPMELIHQELVHQQQVETQCTTTTIDMTQPGAVDERQPAASFSLRRQPSSWYSDIDDVDMFEAERQLEINEPAYKKRRLS